MQIINDSFHGFRQFAAGILSHGKTLGEWVSCRDLQSTRLGLSVVIGGDEIKVADGSDLLRELITGAKSGKLSKDEADVIASQLDMISPRYDHRKCMYFCGVVLSNDNDNNSLTDVVEVATIEAVVAVQSEQPTESVEQDVQVEAPKRGRKAAK